MNTRRTCQRTPEQLDSDRQAFAQELHRLIVTAEHTNNHNISAFIDSRVLAAARDGGHFSYIAYKGVLRDSLTTCARTKHAKIQEMVNALLFHLRDVALTMPNLAARVCTAINIAGFENNAAVLDHLLYFARNLAYTEALQKGGCANPQAAWHENGSCLNHSVVLESLITNEKFEAAEVFVRHGVSPSTALLCVKETKESQREFFRRHGWDLAILDPKK